MTAGRWTDEHGHALPITGYWCDVCGLPLIPVGESTTHPTCAVPVLATTIPDPAPGYCRTCGDTGKHTSSCPTAKEDDQ